MKIIKKLLLIFVLFISLTIFSGCFLIDKNVDPAKTDVSIENGVLNWEDLENVEKYIVIVNGEEFEISNPPFDLKTIFLPAGDYEVRIKVVINGEEIEFKEKVIYKVTVDENEKELIYLELLQKFNNTWEKDMSSEDFPTEREYDHYLRISEIVDVIATWAVTSGLKKAEVQELITKIEDFSDEDYSDVTELKNGINELFSSITISTHQVSNILVHILPLIYEIQIDQLEIQLNYARESVRVYQTQCNDLKNSNNFNKLYNELITRATNEEKEVIDHYINEELTSYHVGELFQTAYVAFYENDVEYLNEYIKDNDIYYAIGNILLRDNEVGGDLARKILYDGFSYRIFDDIIDMRNFVNIYTKEVEVLEQAIEQLEAVVDSIENNKEVYVEGLKVAVDYFVNFYNLVDGTLLSALDDIARYGNVEASEIFIIKDEIVAILEELSPSVDDYKKLYEIMALQNDKYTSDIIQYFADSTYITNTIYLEFLKAINKDHYDDIVEMMDNDSSAMLVVEVSVYVGNFLKDFYETHQDKFDQLEALETETIKTQLYEIEKEVILSLIESGQFDVPEYVADLYDNVYDLMTELEPVITEFGKDVFVEFLDTEGKLIIDIIEFSELSNVDPVEQKELITSIYNGFMSYHDIIHLNLTEDEVERIFNASIPLLSELLYQDIGIDKQETAAFLEDVSPYLVDTITFILEFEKSVADELENNDAINDAFLYNQKYGFEISIAEQVIKALDDVLTEAKKDEIEEKVDTFFNEVLLHDFMLDHDAYEEEEILEGKDYVKDILSEMFTQIDEMAAYNYDNLTEEQYDNIYDFFD